MTRARITSVSTCTAPDPRDVAGLRRDVLTTIVRSDGTIWRRWDHDVDWYQVEAPPVSKPRRDTAVKPRVKPR